MRIVSREPPARRARSRRPARPSARRRARCEPGRRRVGASRSSTTAAGAPASPTRARSWPTRSTASWCGRSPSACSSAVRRTRCGAGRGGGARGGRRWPGRASGGCSCFAVVVVRRRARGPSARPTSRCGRPSRASSWARRCTSLDHAARARGCWPATSTSSRPTWRPIAEEHGFDLLDGPLTHSARRTPQPPPRPRAHERRAFTTAACQAPGERPPGGLGRSSA